MSLRKNLFLRKRRKNSKNYSILWAAITMRTVIPERVRKEEGGANRYSQNPNAAPAAGGVISVRKRKTRVVFSRNLINTKVCEAPGSIKGHGPPKKLKAYCPVYLCAPKTAKE